MNLTKFHVPAKIPAWPLAMVLGLGACGSQGSFEESKLKAETPVLGFTAWCENWSILCESEAAPAPSPVDNDTQVLAAVNAIAKEALANPVKFSVTREEVDSPLLNQAATKLGLNAELEKVRDSLDEFQWQSAGLEGQSLVSRAADAGSVTASNGLAFSSEATLTLSLGQTSSINIDGLSISSAAAGKSSLLKAIGPGEGDSLNFTLASETVQNVPLTFLEDSLTSAFGIDESLPEPGDITAQQAIGAAYPLLSWVNKPQRSVSLNRKFFTVAGSELSPVLAGESFGPAVLNALAALNSLEVSATAGKDVFRAAQVSGAKLECNVNNGVAKVMLDKDFGLKRFYQVDGGIGLEFFGVKASAKLALGIPLTLKRVEIRETKITILDIPIIGQVDVDLDTILDAQDPDKETAIACTK